MKIGSCETVEMRAVSEMIIINVELAAYSQKCSFFMSRWAMAVWSQLSYFTTQAIHLEMLHNMETDTAWAYVQ